MKLNQNLLSLKNNYLFYEISLKVEEFTKKNPKKDIISLGIGDTTLPIPKIIIKAMKKATDEMSKKSTYKGYGPENGYLFLRNSIKKYYKQKKIKLSGDEIFINDGAGRDIGELPELFDKNDKVLIMDPAYPAYKDTNFMSERKIVFIKSSAKNSFLPLPDKNIEANIIYICSPNNPTGSTYDKISLKKWVDFALERNAIILFDAAYEAFVSDKNLVKSIFEIEGSKKCAIEIASLSKTAGFTGIRCGYTIIPDELVFENVKVNKLWFRRQTTKFNGLSYITQRGAEAVFTKEGQEKIKKNINYYKKNAEIVSDALYKMGMKFYWSKNSPYIWVNCPKEFTSWEFFVFLLEKYQIVSIPGVGFGEAGENFVRFSGFGNRKNIIKAVNRLFYNNKLL